MDDQESLDLNLDDIMKEFGSEDPAPPADEPADAPADAPADEPAAPPPAVDSDTVRIALPPKKSPAPVTGDTVRLEGLDQLPEDPAKPEPFSENWEPEYDQPMGDYVPPKPIVFRPKSRLRELKRKLVAGPEKRYYDLTEIGVGKIQLLMLASLVVSLVSIFITLLYARGQVADDRLKLMIFLQFFALLISGLLGSHRMLDGVIDLLRGRFSLNTVLFFSFAACVTDGVFCLQEQRMPCCAAFSLQVAMSLWATYHKRTTEMGQMDTLRKASQLDALTPTADYHEGCQGLLRSDGRVEDFMDTYDKPSAPEKVMSVYSLLALLIGIGSGVAGGMLHNSIPFGVQVSAVALLVAVPVTAFITLTRPMAILEKKLHRVHTVLCGWQGIKALSRRSVFPITFDDLFPAGSCKLNGVKFYGSRDPDLVVAYATALVNADGSGLAPLFTQLLESRNGLKMQVESLREYGMGGIGGDVDGESVMVGVHSFLKDMGVEIPEGTRVNQAVYVAIDGELSGVFAVSYGKDKSSAAGMSQLTAQRRLQTVLVSGGFMLTESFLRSRFNVPTKRMSFPELEVRRQLSAAQVPKENVAAALVTKPSLAPFAYAVSGARSVRTACIIGTVIHLLGGLLGLGMLAALAYVGAAQLLTPANVLLYQLVWLVPGLLITEWTRTL